MRRISSSREAKKAAETVSIVLARAGDGCGYDVDLDDEEARGVMEGRRIPTNPSSATNGSDAGISFDGQKMLQDSMGLYERESGVHNPYYYELTML
jgi:hypothetical protein